MALKIWCDPAVFPTGARAVAIEKALYVLAALEVSLEDVQEASVLELAATEPAEPPDRLARWHEVAWLAAVAAAEVALKLDPTPPGAMLVLDEYDELFR